MKIAMPVKNNMLYGHFGKAPKFHFVIVDEIHKTITEQSEHTPPPHEPGAIPTWLAKEGVTDIIACSMGPGAARKCESFNMKIAVGVSPASVDTIVQHYLQGTLKTGENNCSHH